MNYIFGKVEHSLVYLIFFPQPFGKTITTTICATSAPVSYMNNHSTNHNTNTATMEAKSSTLETTTSRPPPTPLHLEEYFEDIYTTWYRGAGIVPAALHHLFVKSLKFWGPHMTAYERWHNGTPGDTPLTEAQNEFFEKVYTRYSNGPWFDVWTVDCTNFLSDSSMLHELDLEQRLVNTRYAWEPEMDILLGADKGGTKYRLAPSDIECERFEASNFNRLWYLEMRTSRPPARTYIGPLTEAEAIAQNTGPVFKVRILGLVETLPLAPEFDSQQNPKSQPTTYCLAGQINDDTGYIDSFWFVSVEMLYEKKGNWSVLRRPLGYLPTTAGITKPFMAAKLAGISNLSYCTENTDLDWKENETPYKGQQNRFRKRGRSHKRQAVEPVFTVDPQREYVLSVNPVLELVDRMEYIELAPVSFQQSRYSFPEPCYLKSDESEDDKHPVDIESLLYDDLSEVDGKSQNDTEVD
ncbi:uncharacterized protein K452DRAFT_307320 [Aplosporella prunicola CBS 121167]|uniref:Uncharacterized protein n=1 Tax=Aplosporella prunicola CBS 121167 TaxID=1176127 RepID=A0A6A6BI92_9PEZI|nr:uncharacterized protein K452DRAFT_307320 [Aplosporella prunicola CBS 121167]KAF2143143.1 hypothetical protein K452DRAFT_307320 [Aplosporella prunicola CBS 121167]